MAKQSRKTIDYTDVPVTLDEHPFYGFELDEDQKYFVDQIWNDDRKLIVCNAKAGSGKT